MPRHSQASPTPSASFSSDKENHNGSTRRVSGQKRSAMEETPDASTLKRKRTGLAQLDGPAATQAARNRAKAKVDDKRYYDPEQPTTERRVVRATQRAFYREIQDSRNELVADPDEIRKRYKTAHQNFLDVKQTDDATIDSRSMVYLGETARKAATESLGTGEVGINIDDFIGKSIAFMRRGPSESDAIRIYAPDSTQRQRHRPSQRTAADSDNSDDEHGDDGDALDWEWLGRKAAISYNMRPPVPIFLLGPLSVQKKIRKVTQRVARQRLNPEDAVRPDEIQLNEIERNENNNLVRLCKNIYEQLGTTNDENQAAAEAELGGEDDPSDADLERVMDKYGLGDDGGTLLCRFAFNPKSFGQTVENLFYLSFLIKEGKVGLGQDGRGFQTLHKVEDPSKTQDRSEEEATTKHQGVFHLDYDVWEDTIKLFNIRECVIPHRQESSTQLNGRGWYG